MKAPFWIAAGSIGALILALTCAVALPGVVARLEPPPADKHFGAQNQGAFHLKVPREGMRASLELDLETIGRALERAGGLPSVEPPLGPAELRERLKLCAAPDVSLRRPRPSGASPGPSRWQVSRGNWNLDLSLRLPSCADGKEAKKFLGAVHDEVCFRLLRWLRERFPCAECMANPLAWLGQSLDEPAKAREVLLCLRSFKTPEEKVRFLGAAGTQAGLRTVDDSDWAGAWRRPLDPEWLALQERRLAEAAGE